MQKPTKKKRKPASPTATPCQGPAAARLRQQLLRRAKRPLRLEWIEAGSLTDNPDNWRRHPAGQMTALKATLDKVGWAGALLFNEVTNRLIDGHARKDAAGPKTIVPVLVGRWTQEQEKQILATLDPLAAMAETDGAALQSLLADVDLGSDMADLESLLDGMVADGGKGGGESLRDPEANTDRKRGGRVMEFVLGQFHFEIDRQGYDAWLTALEQKVSSDPDRIVRELKRRLGLPK